MCLVEPLRCSAVLTHHWLVRRRGGEKVLAALGELLPGAPVYTLVHDPDGAGPGWPAVHESAMRWFPGARRHYAKLLPLLALAARSVRLPPADLVVCSDAALAKAMRPDPRSRLVCYCHSPMRYAWDEQLRRQYCQALPRLLAGPFLLSAAIARRVDRDAARRVDQFVANSRTVAERIRRFYGRASVVVHPPVDLPAEPTTGPREDFYLCVGHHVRYKRLDLALEACRRLGRRLVVIGDGPEVERLRPAGHERVTFLGYQPDRVVVDHYRRARALLFPGAEDFGLVPVEAMAHGCPVVAYGVGGATETVVDGRTGVLFARQSVDPLVGAMRRAEALRFDPGVMHARMQRFSRQRFCRQMRQVLLRALG